MPQHLTWEVIEAIERGAHRVLLYGPPGTGKTRSAFETAKRLRKRLYNVTLSDETPAAELRGHFVPRGGEFIWMDGPAVSAFREGGVLCLDEIDKASQDCLDFLHGLLNDLEMARLTLPTGEIIEPKKGFKAIATMNGDIRDLQPSLQDRFSIAIEVTTPHPSAVASLPEDLRGVAQTVESYDVQQRPQTIRRWAAFAALREMKDVGVENAAKAVFAHRAPELMDAIGFTATLTNIAAHGEEKKLCDCQDCKDERARVWMSHHYSYSVIEADDDDEYMCPECADYYESEIEALRCCYSDKDWLEYCDTAGIAPQFLGT